MLRYELIGLQIESHRQPMAGNLQIISVIEAINFVLLWKGNHLDTHACKNTHTYTHIATLRRKYLQDDEGAATAHSLYLYFLCRSNI